MQERATDRVRPEESPPAAMRSTSTSVGAAPVPERPTAARPSSAAATSDAAPIGASACEVRTPPPELDRSRVIRYDGTGWAGVAIEPYKAGDSPFRGVTRRVLAAPDAAGFELRYFELDPGGHTTHERHDHVHVVVCMRGRGRVRLEDRTEAVAYGDVVYIAPGDAHQFRNAGDEPFGFLCVVDRERDRPVPIEE